MDLYEVLDQVVDLVRQRKRITYRLLQRRFTLDEATLEDLKAELFFAHPQIADEDGRGLIWTGEAGVPPAPAPTPSHAAPPMTQHPQQVASPTLPQTAEAERRQLTVLFCDLVDSTALSSQLDPEDLREVVQAYQAACAEVIQRFEGHIAQYLGDGLLVYFGYPLAHEDDAQRAVRAGLGMVEALGQLNTRLAQEQGVSLAVRLGIHTGLVVVGEVGGGTRQEQLALGETPNLAARLQGVAAPDTVVISAATHRLIAGWLDCQDLGLYAVKGIATPLQLYRVMGESGARSRLEVSVATGLTPLVGREEEVGQLLRRWEQAKEGEGQVVILHGEAGIGKSRLVQVLKEHIAHEAHARVEYRCSPYYQNSALYPVIEHLQRLLQFGRDEAPEAKFRTLEQMLSSRGGSETRPALSLPEVVPLFATLLSLPVPAHYPPLALTPQRQKQKTLEALLAWLLKEAAQQPLLVVMEDLHWVDPSTLEFLSPLIEQVPEARILIVLTFRPDFSPPWTMLSHLTQLTLSRLARRQVEVMVEKVTGGKTLSVEVVQQLVTKTDGVPLFVEELTKMVIESGLDGAATHASPSWALAIPATLHDSLMARLDRLPTAKEVAQLGATLGREFSHELIQAVSPVEEKTLQSALTQLVDAELLYQRGVPPQARYVFKHALIQDAAYQSLLKSKRQHYHQQIAQILETQFLETTETQPELLAHHYTAAGLSVQAVPYWQQAGQRAIERSANVEAMGHLTRGLELLQSLPVTPARTQQELMLHITLGVPLIHIKGYAAPEVESTYTRARELCQHVGETPQLFSTLWGLWLFYVCAGGHETARELGEQLLSLAQRAHDSAPMAHYALGFSLFALGDLAQGRAHLEHGIALYNPQWHRSYAFLYSQDPRVVCSSYAAWSTWCLGYPDQALKRNNDMLTFARELSHPFSLAFALSVAAALHQFRGEGQAAQAQAAVAAALCAEQGFPFWLAMGTILAGLGAGRAGTGRHRHCPDTPGVGGLPRDWGRVVPPVFPRPARGGLWARRTDDRGAYGHSGGAGAGAQYWRAVLRGGAVSAQRRIGTAVRRPPSAVRHHQPSTPSP